MADPTVKITVTPLVWIQGWIGVCLNKVGRHRFITVVSRWGGFTLHKWEVK